MARPYWRHSTNTEVALISGGTVTTTTGGHTYAVTITDDNGDTAAITYTLTGSEGNVTNVAAGFVTAWNASYNPLISKFTASNVAGAITLTADSAGRPFSLAYSGSGTWSGTGTTTASVSNTDYGQASNWSTDAVPVNSDDVVIAGGTVSIKYGLNQSAVTPDEFVVESSFSGQIGRIESGVLHYLRTAPASFNYFGRSSLAAFDLGSANIACLINGTGRPSVVGRNAVYLKGSNLTTVEILGGNVGFGNAENDTATAVTLVVGQEGSQADVDVTVGSGVTLTTLTAGSGRTLLKCAATTVTAGTRAKVETFGTGAITTFNAYGECYPNSSGTIGTLNAFPGSVVDFTRDRTARTVSTLVLYPGCRVIRNSSITVSATTHMTLPGIAQLEFRA